MTNKTYFYPIFFMKKGRDTNSVSELFQSKNKNRYIKQIQNLREVTDFAKQGLFFRCY